MTMPTAGMRELLGELLAERALLERLVEPLDDATWRTATPRVDRTIAGGVARLAFFDDAATAALTAPKRFAAHASARLADGLAMPEDVVARHRARPSGELMEWLRRAQAALVRAYSKAEPQRPVPWYGTELSAGSAVAARILETWAHGRDMADALGRRWEPTDRLWHVADLGVRTLRQSFELRGRPVPMVPVRIELTAPSGAQWTWGGEQARDLVRGSAEDFCLVLTRRRSTAEVALEITGAVAGEWLAIALAYPGAAGTGRRPSADTAVR